VFVVHKKGPYDAQNNWTYFKIGWDVTWGDPKADGPWYTAKGDDWIPFDGIAPDASP
jgi:hypothetical protein